MTDIHFTERDQQSKAFGLLIHGGIAFSGVDLTTISLSKEGCKLLDDNDVQYEIVS